MNIFNAISLRLSKNRFYGWIVLAGMMLLMGSIAGNIIGSYGIFLPEMCDDLGWSRSIVSAPFSLFWVSMGIFGPIIGITTNRYGPKKNLMIGNGIVILGILGMSWVTEVWHIFFLFSGVVGISQAFGSMVPANTVITNWFNKRRTLAIGLLAASSAAGGFLFPMLTSIYISEFGWRTAWILIACTHALLGVLVVGLIVRNRPEDIGQTPDGLPEEHSEPVPDTTEESVTTGDWSTRDAIRNRSFWLILIFTATAMFTVNFLVLHQAAYVQDIGFSAIVAASTIGIFNGLGVAGQLAVGAIGDKIQLRYIAMVSIIGTAIGITILMNVKLLPFIYVHSVITGMCVGPIHVLNPVMIGQYFGKKNYSRILGWTTPVITLVSAGSPLLAGFIFDTTGSYSMVFIVALVLLAAGLVSAYFARPPVSKR
ncbi:MAG: MFS transporter [Dehalococcoidales bacterium]|nr:MFS transporter [Dehalococcoidales bacterium]